MFNMNRHNLMNEISPLEKEMSLFGIAKGPNKGYVIVIGDTTSDVDCLQACQDQISSAINELKSLLISNWDELQRLCESIVTSSSSNCGGIQNTLFLYNVKRALMLSSRFSQLEQHREAIADILFMDIKNIDSIYVSQFNKLYLHIRLLHRLIVRELYRIRLVHRHVSLVKTAVLGPGFNFDLEMEERMWPAADDEEYFKYRQKARKKQSRYNPEYLQDEDGVYYKWGDYNRDPYLFENMKDESPYPSSSMGRIP